jgi:acyl carrier protein
MASHTRLQEDLGLDSMGFFILALEIGNHWQLYLAEPPEAPPQTLGDLVTLVAQRLREQSHQDV